MTVVRVGGNSPILVLRRRGVFRQAQDERDLDCKARFAPACLAQPLLYEVNHGGAEEEGALGVGVLKGF